jgi:hypothetical protein
MVARTCEVQDCDRTVYARGLCGRHYKQVQRHGAVRPDQGARLCAVEGCGRPAVTRGWCHGHYLRWSRTGRLDADRPLRRPRRSTCTVPGCVRPMHGQELCRTHLRRLAVLGTPAPELPVRAPGDDGWVTHGYRGVVVPEHLRHLTAGAAHVLEHRLVMAVLLGRPLAAGESVHHRGGDRLDNRPLNLACGAPVSPPANARRTSSPSPTNCCRCTTRRRSLVSPEGTGQNRTNRPPDGDRLVARVPPNGFEPSLLP